jgi:hypothetical protein
MFKLIFDVVSELTPNLQIVIMDHADLKEEAWFQAAIVEKWRGPGKALIPEDW